MDSRNFTESITVLCYDFFSNLPKTGKPKPDEWTVLSCIVKSTSDLELEVVSLGTGSKCIGIQKMSPRGDVLNDSHAEIMARRGFMRYLYEQIELAFKSKKSIFTVASDKKCALNPGVCFHLFTSQSPCGDGSIVEGENGLQFAGGLYLHAVEIGPIKRLKNSTAHDKKLIDEHAKRSKPFNECNESRNDGSGPPKKAKSGNNELLSSNHTHKYVDSDPLPVSMTIDTIIQINPMHTKKDNFENSPFSSVTTNIGFDESAYLHKMTISDTKSIRSNIVDETQRNEDNMLGRVRTKPGKGDPTASLSCSDKLARWIRVGIQGAILSLFLDEPIRLDSIIVGGGCPFSKGALYRALVDRSFNATYTNQWMVLEFPKPVVCDECNLDLLKVPIVEQSTTVFEFSKQEGKTPSSASIVWTKVEYL